jgi:hypothetical protein
VVQSESDRKRRLYDSLNKQLSLLQAPTPSAPTTPASSPAPAQQLDTLHMKLVTLHTRLSEADENRKNYELYLIRMKEEDVQLSKQMDQLRQVVGAQHSAAQHSAWHIISNSHFSFCVVSVFVPLCFSYGLPLSSLTHP